MRSGRPSLSARRAPSSSAGGEGQGSRELVDGADGVAELPAPVAPLDLPGPSSRRASDETSTSCAIAQRLARVGPCVDRRQLDLHLRQRRLVDLHGVLLAEVVEERVFSRADLVLRELHADAALGLLEGAVVRVGLDSSA